MQLENKSLIYIENGKCGLKDLNGNVLVKAVYDELSGFCEGLALFKIKGKYGFLNTDGDVAISPIYDQVYLFSNGLAKVCVNNKYGFINKDGNFAFDTKYTFATEFSEGLAFVIETGLFKRASYILRVNAKPEKVNIKANNSFLNLRKFKDGLLPIRFKPDNSYYLLLRPALNPESFPALFQVGR